MDPCPFLRIVVANLALRFPSNPKTAASSSSATVAVVRPLQSSYFCKIKVSGNNQFPVHLANIPLQSRPSSVSDLTCFTLNKTQIERYSLSTKNPLKLKIDIFNENNSCGFLSNGNLLGRVTVTLGDLREAESKTRVIHSGWVAMAGNKKQQCPEFHLSVRAEPDPRFVFQFGGEPECSPLVFQVQGDKKQAVFTSKFSSCRNSGDMMNYGIRSSISEPSTPRAWLPSKLEQRKGWSITIHDLSGSPVAMASMVTPFVPSPGSDRVSQSNPGAWLILRPGNHTWTSWGRLQAWRDGNNSDSVCFRFDLLHDTATTTIVDKSSINAKTGGKFSIDMSANEGASPVISPHSSCDFGSVNSCSGSCSSADLGFSAQVLYKGFVMSSKVQGVGKCSEPEVEIGVQHVTCREDAAAYVALGAAIDLSMDACRSFTHRLRKELREERQS